MPIESARGPPSASASVENRNCPCRGDRGRPARRDSNDGSGRPARLGRRWEWVARPCLGCFLVRGARMPIGIRAPPPARGNVNGQRLPCAPTAEYAARAVTAAAPRLDVEHHVRTVLDEFGKGGSITGDFKTFHPPRVTASPTRWFVCCVAIVGAHARARNRLSRRVFTYEPNDGGHLHRHFRFDAR